MLNMKKVELKLFSDLEMYTFFEKDMRGRVSYNFNGYNKANNKYLKSHDPKQESKHIIYFDVNNVYGMQCLSFFQRVDSNG